MIFFIMLFTLSACSPNNKKMTLNSTHITTIEEKEKLSEKEYASLIGTWECLDEMEKGDKVDISKNDRGVTIKYEGSDADPTEFVSKGKSELGVFYHFENKANELGYSIQLLQNKNIILNFGTRNPEMTGETKPMEYQRIDK